MSFSSRPLSFRPFRSAVLLFAGTALALTGALVPTSAHAAAPQDTITVDQLTETGQSLEISLTASSPITSLSAQLFAFGSATAATTITGFNPPGQGPQSSGIWTATDPIPWGSGAGELPLGVYSIQVTASDQGTTVTGVAAGTLRLLIQPSLTMTASPTTVDWAHRSVTFSGLVTGVYPDGGTSPVQGAIVTVSPLGTSGSGFTATSGADGTYSVTENVTGWEWQASVTGGPGVDTTTNTEQIQDLTVVPDKVKLTAAVARKDVNYGQSDKVTGTVLFKSGSTWQPLSDFPVTVEGTRPGNGARTPITNAAGHFTATLAHLKLSDSWTVSAGEFNAYFTGASTSENISVNWPAKITRVSERLSPFGVVSVSGCIVYKVPNASDFQSTAPLFVDYAAKPQGPWHVLGRIRSSWNGTQMCPVIGANWTGHFAARLANAWYRERIAAATGIEAATSKPVHLWKYLTRVEDFHVSARTVAKGGSLTVSGQLQENTGRWRTLSHQVVLIVLRPKGKKTWYWIAKPHTTASGHFSATFTDPVSATWSATFEGGSRFFASGGPRVFVKLG